MISTFVTFQAVEGERLESLIQFGHLYGFDYTQNMVFKTDSEELEDAIEASNGFINTTRLHSYVPTNLLIQETMMDLHL